MSASCKQVLPTDETCLKLHVHLSDLEQPSLPLWTRKLSRMALLHEEGEYVFEESKPSHDPTYKMCTAQHVQEYDQRYKGLLLCVRRGQCQHVLQQEGCWRASPGSQGTSGCHHASGSSQALAAALPAPPACFISQQQPAHNMHDMHSQTSRASTPKACNPLKGTLTSGAADAAEQPVILLHFWPNTWRHSSSSC